MLQNQFKIEFSDNTCIANKENYFYGDEITRIPDSAKIYTAAFSTSTILLSTSSILMAHRLVNYVAAGDLSLGVKSLAVCTVTTGGLSLFLIKNMGPIMYDVARLGYDISKCVLLGSEEQIENPYTEQGNDAYSVREVLELESVEFTADA